MMKTVRLRIIRVFGALIVGTVFFLLVIKSTDHNDPNSRDHDFKPHSPEDVKDRKGYYKKESRDLQKDFGPDDSFNKPVKSNFDENSPNIAPGRPVPLNLEFKRPQVTPDPIPMGGFGQNDRYRPNPMGSKLKAERSPGYPILKDGKFIPMRRIVHFDLKGAAPRVEYFAPVFKLIRSLGATGVLLEWEDMFPFDGDISDIKAKNAYTKADVRRVLREAKANNLEVIPLVQTFGHLEYILKYPKYMHLRESERFPQVLCLSNQEAIALVKKTVDQVMALHPDITYFHIGADEAFQVGMCEKCQREIATLNGFREALIAKHIQRIAEYVKTTYKKRVMIWHDMINNIEPEMLTQYKLGELVEPVVWSYAENLDEYIYPEMWQRFAGVFPHIWGASAYKGADGPMRYYSNIPHYLNNHISWVDQMTRNYKEYTGEFAGLIFTGWQRYDHFAILCELLPVGLPSLAVNLLTIQKGVHTRRTVQEASDALRCAGTLDADNTGYVPTPTCEFPGGRVYTYVQNLKALRDAIKEQVRDDHQVNGWLARFNTVNNYTQAWYLDQIMDKIVFQYDELKTLRNNLFDALLTVYARDTAEEFLMEYVDEDLGYLDGLMRQTKRLGQIRTFPKRPFEIANPLRPKDARVNH